MIASLQSWMREALRGRTERKVPRRGAKPAIGATIVCGDLRMTVQAGFSDEIWRWLLEQGWRELTFRPDRRHYREIPSAWVTRLIDALPETRALVLEAAIAKASKRPTIGDPKAIASYVTRN